MSITWGIRKSVAGDYINWAVVRLVELFWEGRFSVATSVSFSLTKLDVHSYFCDYSSAKRSLSRIMVSTSLVLASATVDSSWRSLRSCSCLRLTAS